MNIKLQLVLPTSLFLLMNFAQANSYAVSTDGQEVTDDSTGLIWRRCAEGMTWDGTTCAGTALTFTHENALIRGETESISSGKSWRVPNVRELGSIVDRTRSPAIDPTVFPATPTARFWSSSPYSVDPSLAWYVSFDRGWVDYNSAVSPGRSVSNAVRLVRSGP